MGKISHFLTEAMESSYMLPFVLPLKSLAINTCCRVADFLDLCINLAFLASLGEEPETACQTSNTFSNLVRFRAPLGVTVTTSSRRTPPIDG